VAIVPNASVGAYQVASTLMMGCRDRVITTAEAFPSIAHVWLSPIGRVQGPDPTAARDRDTPLAASGGAQCAAPATDARSKEGRAGGHRLVRGLSIGAGLVGTGSASAVWLTLGILCALVGITTVRLRRRRTI
jgi:hypothetical protein